MLPADEDGTAIHNHMQPVFYDPSLPYDKNFENGPVISHRPISVPRRRLTHTYPFLDFQLNTPFGIPAGPLLNSSFVEAAFLLGFDVVHYKTQRSDPFPVNEFPNVLSVEIPGQLTPKLAEKPLIGRPVTDSPARELSITNSFGNPSKGPDFWQADMKKALSYQGEGQLLIASVVGTIKKHFTPDDYYKDFALTALLARQAGAKVIEVNLSCPNVASEGVLCYSPEAVERIVRLTKEKIGDTHLLMKLGYFTADQEDLLTDIVKRSLPFISGIAAINTIAAPVIDEKGKQALPGKGRLKSGICGAGIREAGLDMIARLTRVRERLKAGFAIIGVGGVMSARDFLAYRARGADVVQSATGAMWNPDLGHEIWKELEEQHA